MSFWESFFKVPSLSFLISILSLITVGLSPYEYIIPNIKKGTYLFQFLLLMSHKNSIHPWNPPLQQRRKTKRFSFFSPSSSTYRIGIHYTNLQHYTCVRKEGNLLLSYYTKIPSILYNYNNKDSLLYLSYMYVQSYIRLIGLRHR